MSITLISIDNLLFDDGTISQWKKDHPHYNTYTDYKDIPLSVNDGLFMSRPGILLQVDKILAGDVRKLNKEVHDDVLILSSTKSQANFSKDGITSINLIPPKNEKKLVDFIASRLDMDTSIISKCVRMSDSPKSAFILARQAFLIQDGKIPWVYILNPLERPELPWDMFNAIVSGYTDMAVEETLNLLRGGIDPIQLMFQIIGYFKKVLMVKDDQGGLLKNSNTQWFRKLYNNIKDEDGILQDINYYYEVVLQAPKFSHYTVLSFVSSLSTRFER